MYNWPPPHPKKEKKKIEHYVYFVPTYVSFPKMHGNCFKQKKLHGTPLHDNSDHTKLLRVLVSVYSYG